MPPKRPPHGAPPPRHVPSSAIASFIDRARIEKLLAPWVADQADRQFVVRCLLDEGPAHHRGANYVLLALLGEVLDRQGGLPPAATAVAPRPAENTVAVPMRLPPHLAAESQDGYFPLEFPRKPLERLALPGSVAHDAMVDCLTDGPPQHSLANAAMMCLIAELLQRAERNGP